MTDFMTWPVLHLVSVLNSVGIVWILRELYILRKQLAWMRGKLNMDED